MQYWIILKYPLLVRTYKFYYQIILHDVGYRALLRPNEYGGDAFFYCGFFAWPDDDVDGWCKKNHKNKEIIQNYSVLDYSEINQNYPLLVRTYKFY